MTHVHVWRETPRSMEEGLPARCACGEREPVQVFGITSEDDAAKTGAVDHPGHGA